MSKRIALLLLAACAAVSLSGCGGSSPKPLSVAITASSNTVDGLDTVTLTAAVTNDKNSAGVSWAVTSGGGALSSQTTTSATYTAPAATSSQQSITITATSVATTSQTGTITLTVPATPAVTSLTAAQQAVAVGTAYSVTLAGTGGVTPYKNWALASGSAALPSCLSLSSAGVLSSPSTPTAACVGVYSGIEFTMTDSGTPTALSATSSAQTITVTGPTVTFSPMLPGGNVGVAYTGSVAATGVIGASTYSLASGALPADLTLNASTGAISGTPKASDAGTFNFSVTVIDAFGDTATSGNLSIAITAPTITFPASLPGDTVGTAYSGSVAASGPVGATTYTIVGGALPADLSLNSSTGAITGTPKVSDVGTFNITVKVVDAYGDTATSGSLGIAITAPTITFPSSLSGAVVGTAYSASVAATGAVGASTYTIASGALAADLSLNSSTGAITGTPKASDVGTSTFTIKVVDAFGDTATSGSLSIVIAAAPAITFGAAPTATATDGVAYSSTLTATGGAGTLSFSITTGALPAGLTLNGATGAITGTPTAVGPATFTAKAQDSFGDTPATQSYTITVNPGAATHFAVAITSSSTITAGGTVSFTVTALDAGGNTATGYSGTVAFTSSDTAAALPAASALASGIGSFSAALKTSGSQTITATDNANATISGTSGAITVNPGSATTLVVTAPGAATTNVAFNVVVTAKDAYNNTATGYAGTVHFTSTDSSAVLPANSGLTSGTGTFPVTLKTAGSQTITATDTSTSSITGSSGTITVSTTVIITTSSIGPFDSGQTVSASLIASGGSGNSSNYTWSWVAGSGSSIPPGLSLSTAGAITGTAGTAGNYTVSVTVKDTSFTPNQTYSQNFTITIENALALPTPNPASLPSNGYTGIPYSGSVSASGGSGNYCYSVTGLPSDSLAGPPNNSPCGFDAPSFLVSGTPTAAATVTFTLKVTDTTTSVFTSRVYSITVTAPTAPSLPTPSSSIPGSGTNGQAYSETITATGGVGPTYTWTVNGSTVPTSGSLALGASGLSSQFSVSNSGGGSSLAISGSPTSTGSFTFTAQIKDNTTGLTSSTQTYTIQVNSAGQNVSGQILEGNSNFCSGSIPTPPTFTVNLNNSGGTTVQTTTTDSNGNFTFTNVPNGTYNFAPSYPTRPTGASAVFHPAVSGGGQAVVNNADVTGKIIEASLGYLVTGTAHYSGTTTSGQLYIDLVSSCGSSGDYGTSIAVPLVSGGYTIHGVPPGQYTLLGVIDPSAPTVLGEGAPNSADPTGDAGAVAVNYSNESMDVTLGDPTGISVGSPLDLKEVAPQDSAVVISYSGSSAQNGNGEENYTSYTVQWSTTTTGFSAANQATFKATGSNTNVWIVDAADKSFTGSLTNGGKYYFRAWGTNSVGSTVPAYWGGPGVSCSSSSGTPACAVTVTIGSLSEPNTVSGSITIPAGVTINPGAVLYAGIYDQSTNTAYAEAITSPVSGANAYTVQVPDGSYDILFGILDQNDDGVIDTGDDTNVSNGGNGTQLNVSGSLTGQNVTLPGTNAVAVVQTEYENVGSGFPYTYTLKFNVVAGIKRPVAVTLTGTTNAPAVLNSDIGICSGCGNSVQFQDYSVIYAAQPPVGGAYTFNITYSDGTTDTGVTSLVTGWDGGASVVGASGTVGMSTNLAPSGTGTSLTPNFTWTFPANPADFTYQFQLWPLNQNTLWFIPGNNSNSNGFTYAQTSGGSGTTGTIVWGIDPTGDTSNNLPNGTTLSGSTTYFWSVTAIDSNGNQATSGTSFTTP